MMAAAPIDKGPVASFRKALETAGLLPGEVIPDGVLRRCGTVDHPQSKNGWHLLHLDPPAGAYGNWATGLSETWCGKGGQLSEGDRQRLRSEIEAQRVERERHRARAQTAAIEKAKRIWVNLPPEPSPTSYTEAKGLPPPPGTRSDGSVLFMPIYAPDKQLINIERIFPNGDKRTLKDGPVVGGYFFIGEKRADLPLLLGEGLFTVYSAHLATGFPGLVARNKENLLPVGQMARQLYPKREIIVLADFDGTAEVKTGTNSGVVAAEAACRAIGAKMAVPPAAKGQKVDFDDIRRTMGLEAVKAIIEAAQHPSSPPPSSSPEPWSVPIFFDQFEAPPIPPEAAPAELWEYCASCAEAIQAPVELAVMAALGAVAAAAQGLFQVTVHEGYTERLILYLLACLPPGERKSAMLDALRRPLLDWEREQARIQGPEVRRLRSERATKEKAIEKIRLKAATAEDIDNVVRQVQKLEAELPEVPEIPRLLTDDITPEGLAEFMGQHNECAAIIEAEGGIFELLSGLYTNGRANLNLVLKSWCGEPVTIDRRSRDTLNLQHPALTMCLTPQPEVLTDIAQKPGFRGKGLLGRILYCLPKSLLGRRTVETKPINEALAARYRAMLLRILETPPAMNVHGERCLYEIRLSDDAYRGWVAFAEQVERELRDGGTFENIRDWAGKLPGQAIRIAGIYHVAVEPEPMKRPISGNTMRQALTLAAVLADHALLAFNFMGADPAVECGKRIWRWITDTRPEIFKARDAYQAIKGKYPKMDQVNAGLRVLVERAYIRPMPDQDRSGSGRKPSPAFEVNPYAHNSQNPQN